MRCLYATGYYFEVQATNGQVLNKFLNFVGPFEVDTDPFVHKSCVIWAKRITYIFDFFKWKRREFDPETWRVKCLIMIF